MDGWMDDQMVDGWLKPAVVNQIGHMSRWVTRANGSQSKWVT